MPQFDTDPPIPYVPISEQAAAVRAAIDAARLSNDNSFGGLQRLAIPGPFASDVEANTNGVPDDNLYYRSDGTVRAASHLSLDLAFALDKTLTARIGPTPTFERASGGTYVGSDNLIHGIDSSVTSNTIGTGSKTFTLDAPSGQDQMWRVGDVVQVSNGTNTMSGTVTSYTVSTQVLVCNITSVSGTGTFDSWRVAYRGPRFDHDPSTGQCKGLLIEEERRNFLANSNNIMLWSSVTNTTRSATSEIGPDGNTVGKIVFNDTSNARILLSTSTVHTSKTFTGSVWLRSAVSTPARLRMSSSGVAVISTLDITLTTSWVRYSLTSVGNSSHVGVVNFDINANGVSGVDIFVAMGQIEEGAFPTSYIPTAATVPVVRSADVCSITGTDFSGFYNQSEGSFYVKSFISAQSAATDPFFLSFYNPSLNEWGARIFSSKVQITQRDGLQKDIAAANFVVGSVSAAATYNSLGSAASAYGLPAVGGLAPNFIGFNALDIGRRRGGTLPTNGHIASIRYYSKRLSNAKLQALTTP